MFGMNTGNPVTEWTESGRPVVGTLPNGTKVPMYSVALIQKKNETALVGITGWSAISGQFQYSSAVRGGDSIVHPNHVIEIVDEQFYFNSPIVTIAKFWHEWAKEKQFICPKCKSKFIYPYEWEYNNGICSDCKEGREIRLQEEMFTHVELTDEMVHKYNRKVAYKRFKNVFENKGKIRYDGFIDEFALNSLLDEAKNVNNYKSVLTEEDVQELREIFVLTYRKALAAFKAWNKYKKLARSS